MNVKRLAERKWYTAFKEIESLGPVLALLGLIIILSFLSPAFLSVNNFFNIIQQSSVNLIIAMGMTVVIISGGIDLSVGSVLALVGVTMGLLSNRFGVPPILSIFLGLGLGTLVGAINGFIISRTGIPDFIMTLGMLSAAKGMALVITRGLPVTRLPRPLVYLGSQRFGRYIPMSGIVAIVMVILAWFILNYTKLGRAAYAIGGNKEAAQAAGIDVKNCKVKIYALLGFFVAVAALVQMGRIYSANALMGTGQELNAIAAVIIGGASLAGGQGTISGTVVGALIMGVLGNGLNLMNVSSFWQEFVIGCLIVLVVVVNMFRSRKLGGN
jgi:ribose transport system permease protein